MRSLRWVTLVCAVLATAVASAAEVLPEIHRHLDFARQCLDRGNLSGALASTDLILLPRIKVYVDESSASACALNAFQEAQRAWSEALNGEVQFEAVRTADQAHVVIRYVRTLRREGRDIGGFARWTRSVTRGTSGYESRLTAQVDLRLDQPSGASMTALQLRHAAMHELGHLLGLDDSECGSEIMGPLNLARPAVRLAESEVVALRGVREKAQNMRALAMFKLQ